MTLSQVVGIIPSGLIPLLDGLESRGLLQRRPSASDRRSHALYLTTPGQQFLEKADVLVQEHEMRLVKKVGARGHRELLKALGVFGKRQ
jgi:DNA-binding MarR family transcriptional regulator